MKTAYLIEVETDEYGDYDVHSVMLMLMQALKGTIKGEVRVAKIEKNKDVNSNS